MGSFWPQGLDIKDIAAPYEILGEAKRDWLAESNGVLSLAIQEREPDQGMEEFIIHLLHTPSDRSVALFSVVHQADNPYPARITLRETRIPMLLQKKRYSSKAMADFVTAAERGDALGTKWVSETPSEFRNHLSEVLNSTEIKSEIYGLLASTKVLDSSDDDDETPT